MARSLAARVGAAEDGPTVTTFPDGSVDHLYAVVDGEERIRRRVDFAEAAATGSPAFTLRAQAVEPGGHCVNLATQAADLDGDVTCVGHLDHPVFGMLPVETVSMGQPARVGVHRFDDGDVLTVDPSADIESWSVADLRAVDPSLGSLLAADVVCCANWTTFDAIPSALAALATDVDCDVFLFDPGRLGQRSADRIRDLADGLATLGEAVDVVLAANGEEVRALAGALGDGNDDGAQGDGRSGHGTRGDGVGDGAGGSADVGTDADGDALAAIRSAADLAAAVVHETEAAVAVTPDDRVRVENFDVGAVRHTGGGDRFDAGLAVALARGWSWRDALTLGNACAARYVATGESATRRDIAAFLREHA